MPQCLSLLYQRSLGDRKSAQRAGVYSEGACSRVFGLSRPRDRPDGIGTRQVSEMRVRFSPRPSLQSLRCGRSRRKPQSARAATCPRRPRPSYCGQSAIIAHESFPDRVQTTPLCRLKLTMFYIRSTPAKSHDAKRGAFFQFVSGSRYSAVEFRHVGRKSKPS